MGKTGRGQGALDASSVDGAQQRGRILARFATQHSPLAVSLHPASGSCRQKGLTGLMQKSTAHSSLCLWQDWRSTAPVSVPRKIHQLSARGRSAAIFSSNSGSSGAGEICGPEPQNCLARALPSCWLLSKTVTPLPPKKCTLTNIPANPGGCLAQGARISWLVGCFLIGHSWVGVHRGKGSSHRPLLLPGKICTVPHTTLFFAV